MTAQATEEQISAGCMRMLELFAAICHDPDNAELANQADRELADLDTLMKSG
jgi:hypothetical protein